jgi:hypothetical protein
MYGHYFMKFENVKKLAKTTRLSKRMIRMVDNLGLYDVGIRLNELCIGYDAAMILEPHLTISRTTLGIRVFTVDYDDEGMKNRYFESQSEAFMYALMWLSERGRE